MTKTQEETVLYPAMWWRCTDGTAHALIWRREGPNQPLIQVTGSTWDDLTALVKELGLDTEIVEDEVKGGHRPERPSILPDYALQVGIFYKGFRGKPFHFERRTATTRILLQADRYPDFVEWCERFDIEAPPRSAIKTLRQLGLV